MNLYPPDMFAPSKHLKPIHEYFLSVFNVKKRQQHMFWVLQNPFATQKPCGALWTPLYPLYIMFLRTKESQTPENTIIVTKIHQQSMPKTISSQSEVNDCMSVSTLKDTFISKKESWFSPWINSEAKVQHIPLWLWFRVNCKRGALQPRYPGGARSRVRIRWEGTKTKRKSTQISKLLAQLLLILCGLYNYVLGQ